MVAVIILYATKHHTSYLLLGIHIIPLLISLQLSFIITVPKYLAESFTDLRYHVFGYKTPAVLRERKAACRTGDHASSHCSQQRNARNWYFVIPNHVGLSEWAAVIR